MSLVNYYRPIRIALSAEPGETLQAQPEYRTMTPLFGAMQLGDGPHSFVTLVIDEIAGKPPLIYVDRNNDEDLTNAGPDGSAGLESLRNIPVQVLFGSLSLLTTVANAH